MIVEIRLLKDDGTPILEHKTTVDNIGVPVQWRPVPGQKIVEGHYQLFGLSYQPHVKSLHPSGYQFDPLTPKPIPQNAGTASVSPSVPSLKADRPISNPLRG